MPTSAVVFALLAGVSAATWTVCLKLGSTKINPALGAMVITAVAFLVNSVVMLTMRAHGHVIVLKGDAFSILVGAGVAAAGVDLFALLAYERGLRVTSSLIIGGTSTGLVLLVGFVALQEPLTGLRALAIIFIFGGGTLFLLAVSPVGRALAERIRHGVQPRGPGVGAEVLDELELLRRDVTDLQERVDFTERMLAHRKDEEAIGPGGQH